jgi:hypothetical protein
MSWRERRHRRAQQAAHDRAGALLGLSLVDAVWSNSAGAWFHLACRAHAPAPAIDLACDPLTTDPRVPLICAHCGARLVDPPQD